MQVTQVALGSTPSSQRHTVSLEIAGVKYAIGTLQKDTCSQFQVDYMASEHFSFSHTGDTTVYVTGIQNISYFPLPEDGQGPMITEVASDEDMEDDSEDEEDDEDDEAEPAQLVQVPQPASKLCVLHACIHSTRFRPTMVRSGPGHLSMHFANDIPV